MDRGFGAAGPAKLYLENPANATAALGVGRAYGVDLDLSDQFSIHISEAGLEQYLERKLHLPWRIGLAGYAPEIGVVKVLLRLSKHHLIQHVKRFGPKLHGKPLAHLKVLEQGKIDVAVSRNTNA